MPVAKDQLETIGKVFADAWVAASDVSTMRDIYDEDAVLVSPMFESNIEGRDAILTCFEELFAGLPDGLAFEIQAILLGVDMLNVFWKLGRMQGADTLIVGENGTIVTHYDTGPHRTAEA